MPTRRLDLSPPKLSIAAAASKATGGTGGFHLSGGVSAPKAKPRSLWTQIGDVFTGIIPGIVRMTKESVESSPLGMGVRAGYRAANDKPVNFNFVGEDWNPQAVHQAESFRSTYEDAIHPTRFYRAAQEGRIVDKLLEDAGNVAIVAGPASAGLRAGAEAAAAAGYARTASVLSTAGKGAGILSEYTNKFADAPVALPRQLIDKVSGEAMRTGVKAAAEGGGALSGPAKWLRANAPATFTEQGHAWNKGAQRAVAYDQRARDRVTRDLYREGGLFEKDPALRPTEAEQGAATALYTGVAHADQLQRMSHPELDPELTRKGQVMHDIPEQTMTPDVAERARAYLDGSIDPESKARIDRYLDAMKKTMTEHEARALAGTGAFKGGLDPLQLGDEAIPRYVENALTESDVHEGRIAEIMRRQEAGESWSSLEADFPELTNVLDNPQVYPKKWRPMMRAMALGNENLANHSVIHGGVGTKLPYRPSDLLDFGMEAPGYLPSRVSDLAQPKQAFTPGERTNVGMPGFKGVSSEQMSTSAEYLPYTARTLAEAVGGEAGTRAFNESMFNTVADSNLPTIGQVLGPDQTQTIVNRAMAEAKAQRFTQLQTDRLVGQRLHEAVSNMDHSPIFGDLTDPQAGDFNPSKRVPFENITADTPAMETAVRNKITQRWANTGGVPGQVMDWINTKFKGNVLPFSLRWQLGDAIGGAFMSWVGGGINPAELATAMTQLKNLDPEAVRQIFDHPDFADASLSHGEANLINQGPDAKAPRTPIGKIKNASYRLNNKINEVNRHGYVLAKLDKLLGEHGLSVDGMGGDPAQWAKPEVQHAINTAVNDAMKVMGSFDEMTPFERRYMKRAFPFWAWNRHITALAWRTAIDNPARMMWTMRLGSYGADPDSDLPDFLKGGVGLTDGLALGTRGLNPFSDAAGGEPIYSPTGLFRSMSPGIKIGAAALTGADLNKGLGHSLSTPGGFGQDTGSLLRNPSAIAYQIANTLPVSRVALNMLPTGEHLGIGTGPVARYGTGERMKTFEPDPRIMKLFPLLGIPIQKRQ